MSLLIDFQAVKQMLKDYKNEKPISVSPPTLSLQEDVEPTPVAEQLPMSPGASGVFIAPLLHSIAGTDFQEAA